MKNKSLINTFNKVYGLMRTCVLVFCIAAAILFYVKGYSIGHILDVEGPSGESLQAEKNHENERNKESHDRVRDNNQEGKESTEKDRDRSNQWIRDNVARNP